MSPRRVLVAAAAVVVVAACGPAPALTETPFERSVADAVSTLRAAALTIEAVEHGRLTAAYGHGAFVSYREALDGIADELPGLDGAPPGRAVADVARRLTAVEPILEDPCLEAACDRQAEVASLEAAAEALLEVVE